MSLISIVKKGNPYETIDYIVPDGNNQYIPGTTSIYTDRANGLGGNVFVFGTNNPEYPGYSANNGAGCAAWYNQSNQTFTMIYPPSDATQGKTDMGYCYLDSTSIFFITNSTDSTVDVFSITGGTVSGVGSIDIGPGGDGKDGTNGISTIFVSVNGTTAPTTGTIFYGVFQNVTGGFGGIVSVPLSINSGYGIGVGTPSNINPSVNPQRIAKSPTTSTIYYSSTEGYVYYGGANGSASTSLGLTGIKDIAFDQNGKLCTLSGSSINRYDFTSDTTVSLNYTKTLAEAPTQGLSVVTTSTPKGYYGGLGDVRSNAYLIDPLLTY